MEMSFHSPPPSDGNREYEFSKMIPQRAIHESPSMLQIHAYFRIHFSLFLKWLKKLILRKYDGETVSMQTVIQHFPIISVCSLLGCYCLQGYIPT